MNEQLRLFEPDLTSWVERVWTKGGAEARDEIIAALVQMGRHALVQNQEPGKEADSDES